MAAPTLPTPDIARSMMHLTIQAFYARQMHLLDSGDLDAWATTFTPDGVFASGGLPEPVHGRDTIAAAARAIADRFAAEGIVRRHWIGMLDVERVLTDGSVAARSYALVLEISAGGEVVVRRSTVCHDVLIPDGDGWLVAHRSVTRDGLD